MRFEMPALPKFSPELARKIGVQMCVSLVVMGGTYALTAGAGKVADSLLGTPGDDATITLTKGDRLPVAREMDNPRVIDISLPDGDARRNPPLLPAPVRAATQAAVVPAVTAPAKPAPEKVARVKKPETLPAGVERFDACSGACDSRDPMLKTTPLRTAEQGAGNAAVMVPPANPAVAPVASANPFASNETNLLGKTLDGAEVAIDKMKQAVQGVVNVVW